MGQFTSACNVNIFETKDKNGKGIEHRITRFWPEQFKNAKKLKQVLSYVETK
jgi:hypothetical protein